ncbi:MAG: hypothetical protein ACLPKI_24340 [Streptosporangiaceae bacterium]
MAATPLSHDDSETSESGERSTWLTARLASLTQEQRDRIDREATEHTPTPEQRARIEALLT